MNPQIGLTLAILLLTVLLFMSERIRVDLVALLVLASLALTGLVTPPQALSGFSNSAVVTVWAVYILSGGLSRTGVANRLGRQLLHLSRQGEVRTLVLIMLFAGVMSAFMNNVGVAALLLPVVVGLARRTGQTPSKLLMPLAFGSLLGGLTTLIGTPPNILASEALLEFDLAPFGLFDFAPVGLTVMVVGVLYMALLGRHLLPVRDVAKDYRSSGEDFDQVYEMQERLSVIRLPPNSPLAGKLLAQSQLSTTLGLNVVGIIRDGHARLMPDGSTVLLKEDRLIVSGVLDRLNELRGREILIVEEEQISLQDLTSPETVIVELILRENSSLVGLTLRQLDFRRRFGGVVIAIWRNGAAIRTEFDQLPLQPDDILLVQTTHDRIEDLHGHPDLMVSSTGQTGGYHLDQRLLIVRIPETSDLVDKTLVESQLSEAFGLTVLGIVRAGSTLLMPPPAEQLQAGDTLLVKGKAEKLSTLRAIQDLEVEPSAAPSLRDIESESVGLVEATLSPHTTLVGKNLRQLHFREKYGLNVLAIWREGEVYQDDVGDMTLRFGDAFLLHGPLENLKMLADEPDFLVLEDGIGEAPRLKKAPYAISIMIGVVLSVLLGWLPISIATVAGATLMILSGCLNMEEAYRFIEWKVIFLIAGMLPLGIAMETTGTAPFLAERVMGVVGGMGARAVIAGLFVLTTLMSQVMPNPVVTVLLAPIAINTAFDLSLSPFSLMMVVALAASTSFLSPVGHPANILIMGPGGYRFADYVKVGLPLTFLVLLVALLVLPIFFPLFP